MDVDSFELADTESLELAAESPEVADVDWDALALEDAVLLLTVLSVV